MIRLPVIEGIIRRRLLVNLRIDASVMQRHLPAPFRPKLLAGQAVGGICLIRLEKIRPRFARWSPGLSSENAAHRVAVCWTDPDGSEREGVYIPRRDTASRWNHFAGGRLFPGEHHLADFEVTDDPSLLSLKMTARDGQVSVQVLARPATQMPRTSRFASLEEASAFFRSGSLGYSASTSGDHLDGLSLTTRDWRIEPLDVLSAHSSWFADESRFPKGTVDFDCALIMRNIPHEWQAERDLPVTS